MKTSVIITTFNEANNIVKTITALRKGKPGEIIVVDNSSTDNTVQLAKKQGATVISKKFKTIFDQVLAGVQQAKHDHLLFIYADSIVSPHYMQKMRNVFKQGYDGGAFLLKNKTTKWYYVPFVLIHIFIHEILVHSVWANRGIFVTKQFFQEVFLKQPPFSWWDENLSRTIRKKGRFKFALCVTQTSFRLYEEKGYIRGLFIVLKLYFKRHTMTYLDQTTTLKDWRAS